MPWRSLTASSNVDFRWVWMQRRFADSFGQTPLGIRCTRGENEFNSLRAKATAWKVSSCLFSNSSRREVLLLKESEGWQKRFPGSRIRKWKAWRRCWDGNRSNSVWKSDNVLLIDSSFVMVIWVVVSPYIKNFVESQMVRSLVDSLEWLKLFPKVDVWKLRLDTSLRFCSEKTTLTSLDFKVT